MADSAPTNSIADVQPAAATPDMYRNPKFTHPLASADLFQSTKGVALGHIVIYVSDLNRSIRFYSELLGFELRVRHGVYWAELAAGTTTLALRLAQPNSAAASTTETKEPTAGSASASFFVKDLNAFHERAVQFDGCKVVKEPARQPWGDFLATYADPDGFAFTVDHMETL